MLNDVLMNFVAPFHLPHSFETYSRYEFWVTAHTTIGEGAASQKVTLSPTSRTPAKIASFDQAFVAVAKQVSTLLYFFTDVYRL
jgi:hypothetical protein